MYKLPDVVHAIVSALHIGLGLNATLQIQKDGRRSPNCPWRITSLIPMNKFDNMPDDVSTGVPSYRVITYKGQLNSTVSMIRCSTVFDAGRTECITSAIAANGNSVGRFVKLAICAKTVQHVI